MVVICCFSCLVWLTCLCWLWYTASCGWFVGLVVLVWCGVHVVICCWFGFGLPIYSCFGACYVWMVVCLLVACLIVLVRCGVCLLPLSCWFAVS